MEEFPWENGTFDPLTHVKPQPAQWGCPRDMPVELLALNQVTLCRAGLGVRMRQRTPLSSPLLPGSEPFPPNLKTSSSPMPSLFLPTALKSTHLLIYVLLLAPFTPRVLKRACLKPSASSSGLSLKKIEVIRFPNVCEVSIKAKSWLCKVLIFWVLIYSKSV